MRTLCTKIWEPTPGPAPSLSLITLAWDTLSRRRFAVWMMVTGKICSMSYLKFTVPSPIGAMASTSI